MKSQEIVQKVTARIIEQLEAGVKPWKCAWDRSGGEFGIPCNPKTKEDYKGINIPILWTAADLAGYKTNLWLGFTQAKGLGGQVKKGEKGTHGILYKPLVVDDEKAEDGKRTIPLLKSFVVFNIEQFEGLEHLLPQPMAVGKVFDPIPIAEKILQASGATIQETGPRAFYRRSDDTITLPDRFRFNAAENFYATGLHELTHWTGHERRLDRKYGNRFGDKAYAFEELVAEMGAAFLVAKLGLRGELQHASYIDSWIKVLKTDDRALLKAASQAQKAFEYLQALVDWSTVEATTQIGTKLQANVVRVIDAPEPTIAEPETPLLVYQPVENLPTEATTVAEPAPALPKAEEQPQVIHRPLEKPHVILPSGLRKTPKRLIPPITQGVLNL